MSPASLHALLIALVMVVQTIAGGVGVARATMINGVGVAQHCQTPDTDAKKNGESRPATGDAHRCHDCCLSGGPLSLAVENHAIVTVQRIAVLFQAPVTDSTSVPSRLAYNRFARGPPPAV
jgi:hypothetical protein